MRPVVAVALALVLVAGGLGVAVALRARSEPVPIEGEPPTCDSPERLRGDTGPEALAERVVREVLGEPARAMGTVASVHVAKVELESVSGARLVADVLVDPPCLRSLSASELDLTADSLTSEVDGVLEVRLHDAELRFAETMRAGVEVTAGERVELDLPPDAWAQATLVTADGRRLHALAPT